MLPRDECLTIVRGLWHYLDGALPDALQERVAEHLAECTTCRSYVDFARAFLAALRKYGHHSAPLDSDVLRTRVLRALRAANDPAS